jgi:predicted nucleic acid-binding protein
MSAYADTSILVSLYSEDATSTEATDVFRETKEPVWLTAFGESEFVNAIELRVFRREITTSEAERILLDFQRDLRAGSVLLRRDIPADSYERALVLSRHHTRQIGCRGMDVIHVAIAVELKASAFLTFDKSQAKLARRAGLTVRPGR